jgi:hypothetical protein
VAFADKVSRFGEAGRPARPSSSNGAALTPPAYGVGLVDQAAARQQLTKRFGSFLAGKVLGGEMTEVQAARALRQYRTTAAGKKDLFFHDNAVKALAAKQKLEASNIGVEGYQALADAPELLASGKYKYHPNYRKTRLEQLEEQLAEATAKARESGLQWLRRVYREQGSMAALDAAKEIDSFADDPVAAVNIIRQEEKQRQEAEKRADLIRQAKYTCKKEMYAPEETCDAFFDNLGQQVTFASEDEIEFSDAHLTAKPAKDWQLTPEERQARESLLTPEEKADRETVRNAKREQFQMDALEGAGKAIKTGFYDLVVGMPSDLVTYGVNAAAGTNYAYSSTFGKELYAELAKGEGTDVDLIRAELAKGDAADMSVVQREIDKGHFSAGERDILAYELRRGDRDFRKISGLLEQGKGTDYWKVADMVGKTTIDVGSTILVLIPGGQGVGAMGKVARIANVAGDIMSVYDTLSSARAGLLAATRGDGRGFGEAFGGILQTPMMKFGGRALGHGLGAGAGWLRSRQSAAHQRGPSIDVDDPSLHAARSSDAAAQSGDAAARSGDAGVGPSWSQMTHWQRFKTSLHGRNAIERAQALDFDVDAAADRAWTSTFGDEHIGKISKGEQASIDAGHSVPGAYIHSVRRGNAFEFASPTNLPIFKQLLTHILFEDKHAMVDVGSGGHGGVIGDSHIDNPKLRDSSFVAGNERMAQRAGAMANVWDLSDPHALRTWLARRSSASSRTTGSPGLYAIADWCYSAFTGDHGKGPMKPLADWDASFDAWNRRQQGHGFPHPAAASRSGGLYVGSDTRAVQIAALERLEAVRNALANPAEWLRDIARSADVSDHAARSSGAPYSSRLPSGVDIEVAPRIAGTDEHVSPALANRMHAAARSVHDVLLQGRKIATAPGEPLKIVFDPQQHVPYIDRKTSTVYMHPDIDRPGAIPTSGPGSELARWAPDPGSKPSEVIMQHELGHAAMPEIGAKISEISTRKLARAFMQKLGLAPPTEQTRLADARLAREEMLVHGLDELGADTVAVAAAKDLSAMPKSVAQGLAQAVAAHAKDPSTPLPAEFPTDPVSWMRRRDFADGGTIPTVDEAITPYDVFSGVRRHLGQKYGAALTGPDAPKVIEALMASNREFLELIASPESKLLDADYVAANEAFNRLFDQNAARLGLSPTAR